MKQTKPLSLLVLMALERVANEDNPMTYQDLVAYATERGYPCERKAVGRALGTLRELGYEVVTTKKGSYLAPRETFERGELLVLIDSVLCSRHLNGVHTAQLVEKISALGTPRFRTTLGSVSCDHAGKSNNFQFLYNVEELNQAIAEGKQVRFSYNKYGADLAMHPTHEEPYPVHPYKLILHNQKYYLAGCVDHYDNLTFFRVDKMTSLERLEDPVRPMPEEWGLSDWLEKMLTLPYLYTDTPCRILFSCDEDFIDELVDWFGTEFTVEEHEENRLKISLTSSPTAMLYWALQYCSRVKILEPPSLKERMLNELTRARNAYLAT